MQTIFSKLIRENTGASFLDSGGENGRSWQQPKPKYELLVELDYKRNEVSSTIETSAWLRDNLDPIKSLNQRFKRFQENKNGSWFELIDEFREKLGLVEAARENTYNVENDFSQNILFTYLLPEGISTDDWYYKDDLIIVVQTHNGADVRGGYSSPVFCKANGQCETSFLDWTVGYFSSENNHDQFSIGYASNPTYYLNSEIKKIISHTKDSFTVELNDGDIATLSPETRGALGMKVKIEVSK